MTVAATCHDTYTINFHVCICMESRLWTVLPALIAGMVIGALAIQFMAPPVTGTSVPSHGVTTATGCVKADDPQGWIGVVPQGDHSAVYLSNYTVEHGASALDFDSSLTETAPDTWELVLTTSPAEDGKEVPEGCQPRTVIDSAVAIPATAESLTITLDGERITVVDTTAKSPRFSDLDG